MSNENRPCFFQRLVDMGCLTAPDVVCLSDGFSAVKQSIASILRAKGITTFPGKQGQTLECANFFDDWYLYGVPGEEDCVYSLFKLREQEYDAARGLQADGDTPGVTVSFIRFEIHTLEQCIAHPDEENRKALGDEINRVVAYSRQQHHSALKAYFVRPEAEGPYLIAELYTAHIASFAKDGSVAVPKAYAALYKKKASSGRDARILRFLDKNNAIAGYVVCDHGRIFIQNPANLTLQEKLAILATHTGNVSFHSFAAEVRYHALFLVWYAKIPIPFIGGSAYASAVRADMTIADKEFEGPAPYHNLNSRLVKEQMRCHKDF